MTVEVSDGKLKATRPMTVTVTDDEEEGEVELSTVAPRVAVELTASLEDSDGGKKDVTWKWRRSTETPGSPANCSDVAARLVGQTSTGPRWTPTPLTMTI